MKNNRYIAPVILPVLQDFRTRDELVDALADIRDAINELNDTLMKLYKYGVK